MNAVTDWRSYFRSEPDQRSPVKGAKGVSADGSAGQDSSAKYAKGADPAPFADLHTNFGHREPQSLEAVLRGRAVELWSDQAGRLFIVADEEDADRLMADSVRRGEIYTAAEARRVIQIRDPASVVEIHDWKRKFDGVIR